MIGRYRLAGFFLLLLLSDVAMACVGCGQSRLFSPKILAISMSFILLPVTIVGLIAYKLRKDAKADATSNDNGA
ncbi:MAG TPA: hypothetical protein VM901_03325 [Bdellovibrionota bacterium]|nr:hypothetical protein [Bdellovibrionota bacterium]